MLLEAISKQGDTFLVFPRLAILACNLAVLYWAFPALSHGNPLFIIPTAMVVSILCIGLEYRILSFRRSRRLGVVSLVLCGWYAFNLFVFAMAAYWLARTA